MWQLPLVHPARRQQQIETCSDHLLAMFKRVPLPHKWPYLFGFHSALRLDTSFFLSLPPPPFLPSSLCWLLPLLPLSLLPSLSAPTCPFPQLHHHHLPPSNSPSLISLHIPTPFPAPHATLRLFPVRLLLLTLPYQSHSSLLLLLLVLSLLQLSPLC